MITSYQARTLFSKINRYTRAKIASSWKGSKMPDEWKEIDKELEAATLQLRTFISDITQ